MSDASQKAVADQAFALARRVVYLPVCDSWPLLTAALLDAKIEEAKLRAEDVNALCEAISRIRWARGTDKAYKLDAAIFDAVRIQSIIDASKPQYHLAQLEAERQAVGR